MKMGLFNRIMLVVNNLIILVLSVFILCLAFGVIPLEQMVSFIGQFANDFTVSIIFIAISLILLVASIRLLFWRAREPKINTALIRNTELGTIRISFATLNNMAQKAARRFNEIKDIKSMVLSEMEGIKSSDVCSSDLQNEVKEYIESLAGVPVKEVQVFIDNPNVSQKAKVE